MKYEKANLPKEIHPSYYKKGKNQKFVESFAESEDTVWKCTVNKGEYSSVYSAQGVLQKAIRGMNYCSIVARVVQGQLYLIKYPVDGGNQNENY